MFQSNFDYYNKNSLVKSKEISFVNLENDYLFTIKFLLNYIYTLIFIIFYFGNF